MYEIWKISKVKLPGNGDDNFLLSNHVYSSGMLTLTKDHKTKFKFLPFMKWTVHPWFLNKTKKKNEKEKKEDIITFF